MMHPKKNKKNPSNFLKLNFNLNSRGQAFSAFELLIGAVLALAVLAIIVSTIVYFDSLRLQVTSEKLNNGWLSAVNAPNGGIVKVDSVTLVQGSLYSKKQFADKVGMSPDCITLDSSDAAFERYSNSLRVTQVLQTNVYIQCTTDSASPGCPIQCTISFDKPLENS